MMRDPKRDPRLQRVLIELRTTDFSCDVHAFTHRITRGAGMALLRRRHRPEATIDHVLAWSRAALPLCIITIVACACVIAEQSVSARSAPRHVSTPDVVLLNAAAHATGTARMVDYIVFPTSE